MEEKRRRRWKEKVSYWANLEVSDNEEEEEEKEAVEWDEGEDDGDVFEAQVMEKDGGNEVEIEEKERAMDGKLEKGLIKAGDDEEEQQLEQTEECYMMEQEQERPKDQIEDKDKGAEPRVMKEEEETEVGESWGAAAKMTTNVKGHTNEELDESVENNLAEGNNDERREMDEDEGAADDREEDCYTDRIDEERAEVSNSLLEGRHEVTEETEMVAQPLTDDLSDPGEEEESGEEEASEEDLADEDVVETYCVDAHPSEIFGSLRDFRDASLLTDLTLSTADGSSWRVHALVLAAVSSRICQRLRERSAENSGIHICLGPEVDAVGLAAVVEFAYAGFVSALGSDTVRQVVAAAGTLGAGRVMDLCGQSV